MNAYYYSYIQTASSILSEYSCQQPFALFLKNYFKKSRKFGSRDRRHITDLCYGYLRLGHSSSQYGLQEQLVIGFFLTHDRDDGFLESFKPELLHYISEEFRLKLKSVKEFFPLFDPDKVFDFYSSLSKEIEKEDFSLAHLTQPDFFLRVRPGKFNKVKNALVDSGIEFCQIEKDIVKIPTGAKVDQVLDLDQDCVVQDIASQKCGEILNLIEYIPFTIWDACAGSGGKSIMLKDRYPDSSLFVSDIREEILLELSSRLAKAKVRTDKSFCTDLTNELSSQVAISYLPKEGVDLIVADVPCSGSGTWKRNPEWLRCFQSEMVDEYQYRQISIVRNLIKHIKPGGYLLYITCSVFKKENEDVVEELLRGSHLRLVHAKLNSSVSDGGDSLFTALFTL